MKLLILLTIFQITFQDEELSEVKFRFKNIRCENNNSTLVTITKCFVKAYSRTLATANIYVDILQTLRGPIYAYIRFKYRFNTITRQVYPTVKVEYCSAMKNEKSIEPLSKFIISLFRDSVPQLFAGCPLKIGAMDLTNLTMPAKLLPMSYIIPSGVYRVNVSVTVQTSKLMSAELQVEVNSKIKDFH